MPLVNRTFNQLIDFTRTTSGTYTNSSGFITSTPASVNLLTYTQEFANADWTKTNATITANSTAAPDGTLTADTMTDDATSGQHRIQKSLSGAAAGTTYAFSVYAKAGTNSFVQLLGTGGSGTNAWFTAIANLSTGAITQTGNGASGTLASSSITSVGNGWYRIVAVGSITGAVPVFRVAMVPAASGNSLAATDGTVSYVGTDTSIFIWGTQAEAASTATTYTRNYGGLYPPRFDYDPVTLAPKGLLIEEQRTNLLVRSEEFDNASWTKTRSSITANATTSPDGMVDADKLVEDTTASNTHQVGQTFSATSGTSYSFSVYLKAAERTWAFLQLSSNMFADATPRSAYINLSTGTVGTTVGSPTVTVVDAGGGWWRVIMTDAATATATASALVYLATGNGGVSYTGDGTSGIYIWGAQLEAGAFATSYIPTVASQVTRTADVAAINAPNFAPWYNQSEGTIFVEGVTYKPTSVSATTSAVDISDGGINNRHLVAAIGSLATARTVVGGVNQTDITQTYTANAIEKLAYAYRVDDFAFFRNGSQVGTDTSGTIPTVGRMFMGNAAGSAAFWSGWLRSIRYYPTRLTQAQGQALTA